LALRPLRADLAPTDRHLNRRAGIARLHDTEKTTGAVHAALERAARVGIRRRQQGRRDGDARREHKQQRSDHSDPRRPRRPKPFHWNPLIVWSAGRADRADAEQSAATEATTTISCFIRLPTSLGRTADWGTARAC